MLTFRTFLKIQNFHLKKKARNETLDNSPDYGERMLEIERKLPQYKLCG